MRGSEPEEPVRNPRYFAAGDALLTCTLDEKAEGAAAWLSWRCWGNGRFPYTGMTSGPISPGFRRTSTRLRAAASPFGAPLRRVPCRREVCSRVPGSAAALHERVPGTEPMGLGRSCGGAVAVSVGLLGHSPEPCRSVPSAACRAARRAALRAYACCRVELCDLPDPGHHGQRNWLANVAEHEGGEQTAEVVRIGGRTLPRPAWAWWHSRGHSRPSSDPSTIAAAGRSPASTRVASMPG